MFTVMRTDDPLSSPQSTFFIPYYPIDFVNLFLGSGWTNATFGDGDSLVRVSNSGFGSEPNNWQPSSLRPSKLPDAPTIDWTQPNIPPLTPPQPPAGAKLGIVSDVNYSTGSSAPSVYLTWILMLVIGLTVVFSILGLVWSFLWQLIHQSSKMTQSVDD
eukprot:TRINITY_DN6695_c0_g1_i1.p1 TRINITY_DN6695_c0_g1~~TRINITY_DN6695_c0_g1_i1.p1  ORF type:complete len:159 (-),score=31.07 TRINITY_DN6695_c0_g1_i1:83-559(-)